MPRPSRLSLLAGIGVPLTLLALSGCGGDTNRAETESAVATTAPPTAGLHRPGNQASLPVAAVSDPRRRAYIARTDRVCRRFDPERNTERERARESATVEEATKAYERGTALGESELKTLEAVPPPPRDAALLRANVFGPVRHQLALRARIRSALAAANVPRLRALRAQLDNISRALSAFARGYGWHSCGAG